MPAPLHGQVALSGSAQQLDPNGTAGSCKAFTIKFPVSNAKGGFIGASGVTIATGHQMDPGDELTYERLSQNGQPSYEGRPSDFYVVGTAPDIATWIAFT